MYPLLDKLPKNQTVESDTLLDLFLAYIDEQGITLYPAQEEAILAIYDGQNVVLNTPTGSGKSLVAVALHFWSIAHGRKSFYTCPIKALVNEKFLSLCKLFGPQNVGMSTGDATVNRDAPIICCTAEILANIALREGNEALVQDVVMDEFHYYADRDRGVAWQIPLLTLGYSRFLLMSATLGDTNPIATVLKDLTGRPTSTVKSSERPVPLDFYYKEETLHTTLMKLIDNNKAPVYLVNFTQRECADYAQGLLSFDFCTKAEKKEINDTLKGTKFNSPYGKELQRILRHGIGIHHAGLLPKYRLTVENLAQKGLLKVICGTDTLGVGVNVPIRTVLFTKLCKFDGQKIIILSVRDFQQICGRAGRKGFDDAGTVVVLAPEHATENKLLEQKAGDDPKKLRKIKRKPPPKKGYSHWDEQTFERLRDSAPEALQSQFDVSHGMLLNVLARPSGGCEAMRDLIRSCHESDAIKERLRRHSFKILRTLLEKDLVEFTNKPDGPGQMIRLKIELQEEFSLFQELAIWLIETIPKLDRSLEDYDLDLVSLVEAIVENPRIILLRQLDKLKTKKVMELKEKGIEYDERMEILDQMSYPKPNAEFIYETFNVFLTTQPWLNEENIRPKSIVREMYENYMSFDEYIKEYGLQRSEGLLLRYLTEVYKILVQSVPESFQTESVKELTVFLKAVLEQVDSSLVEEWEKMRSDGDEAQKPPSEITDDKKKTEDITANKRGFRVLIRNEVFRVLRFLSQKNFKALVSVIDAKKPEGGIWQERELSEVMEKYFEEHDGILLDRTARAPEHFVTKEIDSSRIDVEQILIDPEDLNDWSICLHVDVEQSREEQHVVLRLNTISEIGFDQS